MSKRRASSVSRKRTVKKGGGILTAVKNILPVSKIVNKAIDLLPFEAHIPGYSFCGPGTKLAKRLARGDQPVNGLDAACKIHDIAYSKYSDSEHRAIADKELEERAWQRFKSKDASVGEKAAAWAVTTAMKAKTKFGGGKRKRVVKNKKRGKGVYLRPYGFPKVSKGKGVKRTRRRRCKKKDINSYKTFDKL